MNPGSALLGAAANVTVNASSMVRGSVTVDTLTSGAVRIGGSFELCGKELHMTHLLMMLLTLCRISRIGVLKSPAVQMPRADLFGILLIIQGMLVPPVEGTGLTGRGAAASMSAVTQGVSTLDELSVQIQDVSGNASSNVVLISVLPVPDPPRAVRYCRACAFCLCTTFTSCVRNALYHFFRCHLLKLFSWMKILNCRCQVIVVSTWIIQAVL